MNTKLASDAVVCRLSTASTVTAASGTLSAWSTVSAGGFVTGPAPANLHPILTLEGDSTLDQSKDDHVLSLKGRRTKAHVATMEDGSVELKIIDDVNNLDWQAFFTADANRTNVPLAFLSDLPSALDANGVYAGFAVLDFSRTEVMNEIQYRRVKLAYGLDDIGVQRVKVTA